MLTGGVHGPFVLICVLDMKVVQNQIWLRINVPLKENLDRLLGVHHLNGVGVNDVGVGYAFDRCLMHILLILYLLWNINFQACSFHGAIFPSSFRMKF